MPGAEPAPYAEWPAPPTVAGLAACVWRSVTTDVSPMGSLILPDGCMDLVWSPGREPFVAGPDRTAWAVADPVGTVHVGVRFRPGAGPAVIGVPAVELVNQQVPLADLWGSAQARAVTEQLEGAASAAEAIRALVGSAADRQREADGAVVHAVDIVSRRAAGHRAPLDGGLGERQIRRRFVAAVGYGPKTLERILRFQQFLRIARHDAPGQRPTLARLAAEAGYADQAHLTRESRDLAGLVPSALLG